MIEATELSVTLGSQQVLDKLTLSIAKGEFICIVGPNGAGKSSLLRALAGLVAIEGKLRIAGRDARTLQPIERARITAYLPQGHAAHWPITTKEAVAIGRIPYGARPGHLQPADLEAVTRALADTGATQLAHRAITTLSGGERARVMLARALAVEAPILLADEPTAALDPAHQLATMSLLQELARRGSTILIALHDLTLAARFASRVIVLHKGHIRGDGPPHHALDDAALRDVFGLSAARLPYEGTQVLVPWLTRLELRR